MEGLFSSFFNVARTLTHTHNTHVLSTVECVCVEFESVCVCVCLCLGGTTGLDTKSGVHLKETRPRRPESRRVIRKRQRRAVSDFVVTSKAQSGRAENLSACVVVSAAPALLSPRITSGTRGDDTGHTWTSLSTTRARRREEEDDLCQSAAQEGGKTTLNEELLHNCCGCGCSDPARICKH